MPTTGWAASNPTRVIPSAFNHRDGRTTGRQTRSTAGTGFHNGPPIDVQLAPARQAVGMTSPLADADPRVLHALHALADALDQQAAVLRATMSAVQWQSTSATMLRGDAENIARDLASAAGQLRGQLP